MSLKPYLFSAWKTATIDKNGSVSDAVDLGLKPYQYLNIIIPTIDEAEVSLQVSNALAGDYQDLGDGVATATTEGSYSTTLRLGGWRYLKVKTSADQTTDAVAFKVRGYR